MRVLILGGTAEARELARHLVAADIKVVSSLAGRVSRPRLPVGEVRIGGFGGVAGLAATVQDCSFTHLVDATHPFAAAMTDHALRAAQITGVPLLRYARPGWRSRPDAGGWHWTASLEQMRTVAQTLGVRPFIATGRQTLPAFAEWRDRPVLVRVVEPLQDGAPSAWTVVQDRGPYNYAKERELLQQHRVDVLLTKDSGGTYTSAKLDAARDLGIPVVVLARPEPPAGLAQVSSINDVLTWLHGSGAGTPPGLQGWSD